MRTLTQEEEYRAVTSWREELIKAVGALSAAFPNIRESAEFEFVQILLENGPVLIEVAKFVAKYTESLLAKYAESLLKEGRIDRAKYESIMKKDRDGEHG